MTLDDKMLRELFEHKSLKPANIRMNKRNVHILVQLKQIINAGLKI